MAPGWPGAVADQRRIAAPHHGQAIVTRMGRDPARRAAPRRLGRSPKGGDRARSRNSGMAPTNHFIKGNFRPPFFVKAADGLACPMLLPHPKRRSRMQMTDRLSPASFVSMNRSHHTSRLERVEARLDRIDVVYSGIRIAHGPSAAQRNCVDGWTVFGEMCRGRAIVAR